MTFIELNITTPTILFSTISLIHVAYTNRFVAISNLIRNLKQKYSETHDEYIITQINNLRKRIYLIRNMQLFGIISLLICILSIVFIFIQKNDYAVTAFAVGLSFLIISIVLAAKEIWISVQALNIELQSMEEIKSKLNVEKSEDLYLSHNLKKLTNITKTILGDKEE